MDDHTGTAPVGPVAEPGSATPPLILPDHIFGAIPSPDDGRDYELAEHPGIAVAPGPPPASASLSPLPIVYDQDNTPWCVAEATTGVVAYLTHLRQGAPLALFDQRSVHDAYDLCKARDGIPNVQGTYPRVALEVARTIGILGTDGKRYKIKSYWSCLTGDRSANLRVAIGSLGLPVVAALAWPQAWYDRSSWPNGYLPAYPPSGNDVGGHAFWIWRFFGGFEPSNRTVVPTLTMRNSWSLAWNLHGNANMEEGSTLAACSDLWAVDL